ncbi:aldo/keto reductase [Streptomyces sp. NPDC001070]
MRTTTLGAHGPEVGVIGLGAMGMSFAYDMATPRDEATSVSVIHQAIHPVTTVQSEFSLWTRDVQAQVLPYCEEHGIGLLPYSPLGRGFLIGRFASFDELPHNDQRRRLPRFQQDNLQANLDIAAKVREVADRAGVTPAQVALAWLTAQGPHVVPIPGTKTPKYLTDNAGAADLRLSAADLADLDALPAPVSARY